jgi:hypothetical protein
MQAVPMQGVDMQGATCNPLDGVNTMQLKHTGIPPPNPAPLGCSRIIIAMRCRSCARGFFTARSASPTPCPACQEGRLYPTSVGDLRSSPAPAGMLWRSEL